jgi:hypothetical protein
MSTLIAHIFHHTTSTLLPPAPVNIAGPLCCAAPIPEPDARIVEFAATGSATTGEDTPAGGPGITVTAATFVDSAMLAKGIDEVAAVELCIAEDWTDAMSWLGTCIGEGVCAAIGGASIMWVVAMM